MPDKRQRTMVTLSLGRSRRSCALEALEIIESIMAQNDSLSDAERSTRNIKDTIAACSMVIAYALEDPNE